MGIADMGVFSAKDDIALPNFGKCTGLTSNLMGLTSHVEILTYLYVVPDDPDPRSSVPVYYESNGSQVPLVCLGPRSLIYR